MSADPTFHPMDFTAPGLTAVEVHDILASQMDATAAIALLATRMVSTLSDRRFRPGANTTGVFLAAIKLFDPTTPRDETGGVV